MPLAMLSTPSAAPSSIIVNNIISTTITQSMYDTFKGVLYFKEGDIPHFIIKLFIYATCHVVNTISALNNSTSAAP